MSKQVGEKWAPGPRVKVEVNGVEITTTVCEHRLPAIECPDCDLFGQGFEVEDMTDLKSRLRHPLRWLNARLWLYLQTRRKKNDE